MRGAKINRRGQATRRDWERNPPVSRMTTNGVLRLRGVVSMQTQIRTSGPAIGRLHACLFGVLGLALAGCAYAPPDGVPPPGYGGPGPAGYAQGPAGYGAPGAAGYGEPGPAAYGAPGAAGYGGPGAAAYGAPGAAGYGGPGPAAYGGPGPAAYGGRGAAAYGGPGEGAYAEGAPGAGITRPQYVEMVRRRATRLGRDPERAAQMAERRFDMIDTNHDGLIEPQERAAWRAAHAGQAQWRQPPAGGGYRGGAQAQGGYEDEPPGEAPPYQR